MSLPIIPQCLDVIPPESASHVYAELLAREFQCGDSEVVKIVPINVQTSVHPP